MNKKISLIYTSVVSILYCSYNTNAQSFGPFVIIDKKEYVDLRQKPDIQSKVVGQVKKHQLLSFSYSVDESEEIMNYVDSTWIPVFNDNVKGYINRDKIIEISKLKYCVKFYKNYFKPFASYGSIVCKYDSLTVTMDIQPFNEKQHKIEIIWDGDSCINRNNLILSSIDGHDFFGVDNRLPTSEIRQIIIKKGGRKRWISQDKISQYYEICDLSVFIGFNNELYLVISGGGDSLQYRAYISVVDGNIVSELIEKE
jgi:hypothetical protein